MSSINSIFQQSNPYEKFVQQLVALESRQKLQLEARQEEHRKRKTALGEVSSSVSRFISQLDELSDPTNKPFHALATSSSDETVVTVHSASGIDRASTFDLEVERLAANDTALSQVMSADDTGLAAHGDGSVTITIGDKTETIAVETTKEDDGGNTVDKTNREILESFADAITAAFGDEAGATVFQVNDTDVQLSVQSLETGFENRIQMDGATGVLAEIETNMTRLVEEDKLNAKFTIDGVTFERSSNTIDDAIEGLSFTLLKGGGETARMSVQKDLETSRSNIDEFISVFNDLNQTIRSRTFVDGNNNTRGPLQEMRSIRNLTVNLRMTGLQALDGAGEDQIARLSDLGIGFRNNGAMYIDDEEKLTEALANRSDEVAELFGSEDSPIATMKEQAETYTKASGVIPSLEAGVDQTINRLDSRIAAQERYLEQYEEQQREIFNELQLIIQQGEAQFNQVMNFRASMGF